MKIEFNVFWKQYDFENDGRFFIISGGERNREIYEDKDCLFLKSVEVEIEDITAPSREHVAKAKVASLRADRNAIMADTQKKLNAIDDKIQQLSCLEYKGECDTTHNTK